MDDSVTTDDSHSNSETINIEPVSETIKNGSEDSINEKCQDSHHSVSSLMLFSLLPAHLFRVEDMKILVNCPLDMKNYTAKLYCLIIYDILNHICQTLAINFYNVCDVVSVHFYLVEIVLIADMIHVGVLRK